MLTFAMAVFFLLVTPGPGVLTTAGIGSGFGYGPGLRFLVGLFIGTNLVALGVVSGLAAIVFSVPWLRTVLAIASAAYLLYLALRIALSGSKIAFMASREPLGIINGILLQAVNPKAYAVNTMLFTNYVVWPDDLMAETVTKFVIINLIWVPIHLAWLAAGVGLHRLQLSHRTQMLVNGAMALALVLVVGLAVWTAFRVPGAS